MGYYTGNGVVVGGGESRNILRTFPILGGGSFEVMQTVKSVVTRKSGVSLGVAQSASSTMNTTNVSGGSGAYAWIVFDANGTRSSATYSRIGDSSLYELTITTDTLTTETKSA